MGEMVEREISLYEKIKCASGIDHCECGNPKNKNQKYCSVCFHNRRFVLRQCPVCSTPFWANNFDINNNRHVYCSIGCQSIGVNLFRYSKLIKHSLDEVINASIAGLKYCGYHKRFEHHSDFYRSKRGMFGLCPICKQAQFEKYRAKNPEPKRKRTINNTADKSEFIEIVKRIGKIKQSAKEMNVSWQHLFNQRKNDPNFDKQVITAKDQYYQERYGADYKRDHEGLNEDNYKWYVNNKKLSEDWIKSAVYVQTKKEVTKFDLSEIIQLAVLMWCYSKQFNVLNKEQLFKHYGKCAYYNLQRLTKKIITP